MSNGTTAVFFDIVALAGSELARTPWQRKLVYWLIRHDQSRIGSGCAGFDVGDFGFTPDDFDAQKRFALDLVDAAANKHGWERLPFEPDCDYVTYALSQFRSLVERLRVEHVAPATPDHWCSDELPSLGLCEVHRVFLHEAGCIVCNDAPLGTPDEAAPHRAPP
jgi:hypothetical protein